MLSHGAKLMRILPRIFAPSLLAAAALTMVPAIARANLVTNGTFTSITYTGTPALTTKFGQFGNNGGPATGATLTVGSWDTSGYNFVYAPGTADSGTSAAGANAGAPNQAPGQFNAPNGYGSTYLWGANNGGAGVIKPIPSGGNFVAADGAYETGAITQSVTGLTVGKVYQLSFYWAGAQQQSFDGATTDAWQVSLLSAGGQGQTFTTTAINVPTHGFTGWFLQTFNYTATSTSETLSFLAQGTPSGQPPFSLLGGVSLDLVPEFSHWSVFAGFGALCMVVETFRRRRGTLASGTVG